MVFGAVVFSSVIGSFGLVAPASAQMPVAVAESVPDKMKQILDQVWEGLKAAVLNAAVRVVSYGLRKVAYDGAVYLASGGKGQEPLFHTKSFTDYISNVGDQAFGQAIEELSRPLGFSLCKIPDVKVDLALKVGLRKEYFNPGTVVGGPVGVASPCTFQTFTQNWSGDAWKSQFSTEQLARDFNQSVIFDSNSDLGIEIAAKERINNFVSEQTTGNAFERLEGQGTKRAETTISGDTKVTAQQNAEGLKSITPDKQVARDQDTVESLLANGDIKVIPTVLSIFLSTLASTMVKNYSEHGILPFGIGCAPNTPNCFGDANSVGSYTSQGFIGGRSAAQDYFSSFLETPSVVENSKYDVLGDLGNCEGNGLYNCRADSGLVQAIQEGTNGAPLTIAEALKRRLLHGEWKLIPPTRVADNTNRTFCQQNYCYSNIAVLRQLRILPLGFEIAVKNSDPDHPWTLQDVVNGFDSAQSCNYTKDNNGTITGVAYDQSNKPFCRLIDPNWVIKLPESRCSAEVYGSIPLSSGGPDRVQECADMQNCVAYNADGTCRSYGYCTQEKNTWEFAADTCNAQFRTCRSYQNANGSTVAYLYRTLDTNFCTQDTVGCRAYSLNKDANGWKTVTAPSAPAYESNGIYLNNKATATCSANSAGCSVFKTSGTNTSLYLKKAPSYLGCYGSYPNGAWPQTPAELNAILSKQNAACSQYASVCIPREQSCNWFTSTNGGTAIPGTYTPAQIQNGQIVWNDQCDARCVGYNAYQELPSTYSDGESLSYIVPNTGQVCQASEVGCSSFTNLGTTQGGTEKVEYYSYLRACATPDQNKGVTYVTYEGSKIGGFQLKTYILVPDQNGAPAYFYKDQQELNELSDRCSEQLYKAGSADYDCRQLSDPNGAVYYRILSHTIPVSAQCTPYRLNNSELYVSNVINTPQECSLHNGLWQNNQCKLCFQNGSYDAKQGACIYYGLPGGVANTAGSSSVCSASANSCRAYKGNNGNNVKQLAVDTFENTSSTQALAGWNAASALSTESTKVGGHSLTHSGQGSAAKAVQLNVNNGYDLTFWAKGSASTLTVSLKAADNGFSRDFGTVAIGDTWNLYHLGPVDYTGATTTATISFTMNNGGTIYLDNVGLVQMDQNSILYRVKNTLRVDAVCDSHPEDNLPGEALGCMAYKDTNGATVNLTNFSYLCREGAIGCTAVYDTHNTVSDVSAKAYNVLLSGNSGEQVTKKVGGDSYTCQIPKGQTSCYVNVIGHTASEIIGALGVGAITPSTVYIPPDAPTGTPMYLVANQAATCSQTDVGCMLAGVQSDTPTGPRFSTTTIKNNPDDPNYAGMLCQSEAVGCGSYASGGSTFYFKDPAVTGQKVCTYRTGVSDSKGVKHDGWFWKGVGVCSNDNSYCSADADCGDTNATCTGINDQPCYPKYLENNSSYGLWSTGDTGRYDNFVGECPIAQNMCTEFLDHSDVDYSVNPSGTPKAYYLINNSKISSGDCNGQVNQKTGCSLFDQADNPNKYWSTSYSYAQSNKLNQAVPATADPNGLASDANVLIKVNRDRMCAEWLQCRSSHRVWDEKKNAWKQICDDVGRCNAVITDPTQGEVGTCANWVDGKTQFSGRVLTPQAYVENRDISWAGTDFSGYSLLNLYPVEELVQVNIQSWAKESQPDWRLLKKVACGDADNNKCPEGVNAYACRSDKTSVCGRSSQAACISDVCVMSADGTALVKNSPAPICRAYPEKDSPFPSAGATAADSGRTGAIFADVNRCSEIAARAGDPATAWACECSYTKVKYGDTITKFWNYQKPNSFVPVRNSYSGISPVGICLGGSQDGRACSSDANCYKTDEKGSIVYNQGTNPPSPVTDGVCQKRASEIRYEGWEGYCLQYDYSRTLNGDANQHPCLTWLPVDNLSGYQDISSQHTEAGYEGTGQYCIKANLFKIQPGGANNLKKVAVPLATNDPNAIAQFITINNGVDELVMGCETFANIDPLTSVAWTERMWDSQNNLHPFTIQTGVSPFEQGIVAYTASSTLTPFARSVDQLSVSSRNPPLVTTPWCGNLASGDLEAFMPNVDLSCSASPFGVSFGDLGPHPKNNDGSFVSEARPYSVWQLTTKSQPVVDAYCMGEQVHKPCGSWRDCNMVNGKPDPNGTDRCIVDYDPLHCKIGHGVGGSVNGRGCDNYYQYATDQFNPDWKDSNFYLGYCKDTTVEVPLKCQNPATSNDPDCATDVLQQAEACTDPNTGKDIGCVYKNTAVYSASLTDIGNNFVNNAGVCSVDNSQCTTQQSCAVKSNCVGGYCIEDENGGKGRLQELFARVTTGFKWTTSSNAYGAATFSLPAGSKPTRNAFPVWDVTELGDVQNSNVISNSEKGANPPQVLSIGKCQSDGNCAEGLAGVSVQISGSNAQYNNGVVVLNGVSKGIYANFFAFADKNHMPLKQIIVDWNDGNLTNTQGSFRNQRGAQYGSCGVDPTGLVGGGKVCRDPRDAGANGNQAQYKAIAGVAAISCNTDTDCPLLTLCQPEGQAPNFGTILNKTCDPSYFQFFHGYQCAPGGQGWADKNGEKNPGDYQLCKDNGLAGGCCVFTPKVNVTDNWGWCNGTCGDAQSAGGTACYNAGWKLKQNPLPQSCLQNQGSSCIDECVRNPGRWTPASAKIIVAP